MAQTAEKLTLEFTVEETLIWLHKDGRKKDGKVKQPPLNAAGLRALEKYRTLKGDKTLVEVPVSVKFPFIKGGLWAQVPEAVRNAFSAQWAVEVGERMTKLGLTPMKLDVDGDFIGNARIRINRIFTPKAMELFCEPFPKGEGSGEATAEAAVVGVSL